MLYYRIVNIKNGKLILTKLVTGQQARYYPLQLNIPCEINHFYDQLISIYDTSYFILFLIELKYLHKE